MTFTTTLVKVAWDNALRQIKRTETQVEVSMKSAVDSYSDLPTSGNSQYDARVTLDDNHLYIYDSAWYDQGPFDITDLITDFLGQSLS